VPGVSGEHGAGRRARYAPAGASEAYIVPLLAAEIRRALELHAAPRRPGARALDVGCGAQPLRADIERLGYAYAGADRAASERVAPDHVWDLESPPPASLHAAFDLVVCTEVLEHVARWDAAFVHLARVLADRGRLLVTCPFVYGLHEEPRDFWRPTGHAVRHFADAAGLAVRYERAAGDAWDVLGTVLASARLQPASLRPRDRVAWRLASAGQRWLGALLASGRARGAVRAESSFYLANVLVLEK